jgi:hypothetical protein
MRFCQAVIARGIAPSPRSSGADVVRSLGLGAGKAKRDALVRRAGRGVLVASFDPASYARLKAPAQIARLSRQTRLTLQPGTNVPSRARSCRINATRGSLRVLSFHVVESRSRTPSPRCGGSPRRAALSGLRFGLDSQRLVASTAQILARVLGRLTKSVSVDPRSACVGTTRFSVLTICARGRRDSTLAVGGLRGRGTIGRT